MLDRISETSYTINNAPSNTKYIVQALSYTGISDNVNSDGINQIKNDNKSSTDNNIQEESSDNNYIYYVIGGIGIIAIVGGLLLLISKKRDESNE